MRVSRSKLLESLKKAGMENSQAALVWDSLEEHEIQNKFNFSNIFYYLGALTVLLSLTWHLCWNPANLSAASLFSCALFFALSFFSAGFYFWDVKNWTTLGGLFFSLVAATTPLLIYTLQKTINKWPIEYPGLYNDFYHWVRSGWLSMEIGTLTVAALLFYFFRFPFLTAIFYFVFAYFIMDIQRVISQTPEIRNYYYEIMLFTTGSLLTTAGIMLDKKRKFDLGFWAFGFGALMISSTVGCFTTDSELSQFLSYAVFGSSFIIVSALLKRKIFLVMGAVDLLIYLGHLSSLFHNSILFSLSVCLVGLTIMLIPILGNRYKEILKRLFITPKAEQI